MSRLRSSRDSDSRVKSGSSHLIRDGMTLYLGFGLVGRHSKLYCLCNRDIQNFIVCASETFKTLFVQSRHSKLYCLCSRDIRNFIVCAIATFKTLLFVQSSHSKLFSLCVPSGAP